MIARLPCFATGVPAAATTSDAAVEMLNVPLPSPPVPTRSIVPGGASTLTTRSRIAPANPASSSVVSPRIRSATRRAASWAGVASPSMTEPIALRASSIDRVRPSTTAASAARTVSLIARRSRWPRRPRSRPHRRTAASSGDSAIPPVANVPATSSSRPASPSPASRRKLARRCGPSGVSTDSGWNWTPSSGRLTWRRPMITPSSSVIAVTRSSSGSVARSTHSEW